MNKIATVFCVLLVALLLSGTLCAQGPVPIVTTVFIDSAVYNGIYTGAQNQIFCEPNTGNLIASWYRYYSSGPDPRRITAATSIDSGQTWTIHENINLGVGTEMNARYPSVSGTQTTPIVAYADRNPGGANQNSRPVVATDILGWGGDLFDNTFVDNGGTVDTVLYGRYLSVSVAPDNENLWGVGAYHTSSAAPGESYFYYYSEDGGVNWNGPKVFLSAIPADSQQTYYVDDLSIFGCAVSMGNNNEVMAVGNAQWASDADNWRIVYTMSTDKGNTWSQVAEIPGTESLTFSTSDIYRPVRQPLLDNAGNWHVFVLGVDTMSTNWSSRPQPYRIWDFIYDGSTWTINPFVTPQLLENGLAVWGDEPPDEEDHPLNEPALGFDGTLYFAYSDVVDTTGASGSLNLYNHNLMIMYSEDNGATWQGPKSVLDQWQGYAPTGMARNVTDKLHLVYRRHYTTTQADEFWYLGVPVDSIKIPNSVGPVIDNIPSDYKLYANYPNPFNPTTSIRFDLRKSTHVILTVYNTLGQEVAVLVDKDMTAGLKGVVWDASNVPSGTYFYTIKAGDFSENKKMVLVR